MAFGPVLHSLSIYFLVGLTRPSAWPYQYCVPVRWPATSWLVYCTTNRKPGWPRYVCGLFTAALIESITLAGQAFLSGTKLFDSEKLGRIGMSDTDRNVRHGLVCLLITCMTVLVQ